MNILKLIKLSVGNNNKFFVNGRVTTFKSLSSTWSKKSETIINNEPIKYSRSAASEYKAKTTRTGVSEPRLWYEPYVLIASISAFLIYFTMIREENDIDRELNRSLYSRISGLEEHQLKLSLEYNQQHGLETGAIIQRLKELEKNK